MFRCYCCFLRLRFQPWRISGHIIPAGLFQTVIHWNVAQCHPIWPFRYLCTWGNYASRNNSGQIFFKWSVCLFHRQISQITTQSPLRILTHTQNLRKEWVFSACSLLLWVGEGEAGLQIEEGRSRRSRWGSQTPLGFLKRPAAYPHGAEGRGAHQHADSGASAHW